MSRSTAAEDRGTRCSRPAFVRSAGMIQSCFRQVDLVPGRAAYLTGPRRRECQELQGARRHSFTPLQCPEPVSDIIQGDCRLPAARLLHLSGSGEHLLQVSLPSGRILTLAKPHRPGPVQHGLDPLSHPRCRLVLRAPDWAQDGQDILHGDRRDRLILNHWKGVGNDRRLPLSDMLGIGTLELNLFFEVAPERCLEGGFLASFGRACSTFGLSFFDRVTSRPDPTAHLCRLLSRLRKAYLGIRSQTDMASLALHNRTEYPRPRARLGDIKVQTAHTTNCMQSRCRQILDLNCLEFTCLLRHFLLSTFPPTRCPMVCI